MTSNPLNAHAYQIDYIRRSWVPSRPWSVALAEHLIGHPSLSLAHALVRDMQAGRPLNVHLSPMQRQRSAFKRAHKKDNWVSYKRMMDHLLNKWGFRHFHCDHGAMLVFVYLCEETGTARIIDLVPHDGNWFIEKRLVEIVVRSWPDSGIARDFGRGPSSMTEEDYFAARKQGLNMTVNIDGTYYLPGHGALMSDGSAYGGPAFARIMVVGKRYERSQNSTAWLDSPVSLALGLDPEDARTPWQMAAAQAGMMASAFRPVRRGNGNLPVTRAPSGDGFQPQVA